VVVEVDVEVEAVEVEFVMPDLELDVLMLLGRCIC
jgi:hypothetical protein